MNRFVFAFVLCVPLLLVACHRPPPPTLADQCQSMGYAPGTPLFLSCLQTLQAGAAANAAADNANRANYLQMMNTGVRMMNGQ
jgi:hypothetical protein